MTIFSSMWWRVMLLSFALLMTGSGALLAQGEPSDAEKKESDAEKKEGDAEKKEGDAEKKEGDAEKKEEGADAPDSKANGPDGLDPSKAGEAVPNLAGGDPALTSEVEGFQKVFLRYQKEIVDYRREVNVIVQNEYGRRRAEIEAVYDKEIKGLEILERERRDEAIAAFEEFLRKYPRNAVFTPDVIYRLAELYFEKANDDYLLADERYEQRRELYELGRIADPPLTPDRNYDKTVSLFQRLITDFPDYRYLDGAYYLLGYCLVSTSKDREARNAFEDLIRLRPDSKYVPEAWVRIGEYYFDYGELEQAISSYAQALNFPENTFYDKALYKLAWSYYRIDRFEEAIQSFKDLVLYADRKKRETGKTGSELREEAIQYLAISLAEEDWNNDGLPDEEFGMPRVNRFLGGEEEYQHEVLLRLGDILFDNTRYQKAISVYRTALNDYPLHPENPKIHDKTIIALERLRRFDEAVEARRQIGLNYGPGTEWHDHQKKEGNQEAMAFAEKLSQDMLIDSATWYHEQAQKLREEAVSRQDVGMAQKAKNRFSLAAEAYSKYLETYPHDKEAYKWQFYLAECLFYSQQYEEAADAYVAVRELSVGNNKFREQAAFNAIKALEFIIARRVKSGDLPLESLSRGESQGADGTNGKGRDEPMAVIEPKEIPEIVERLNKTRMRYVDLKLKSSADPFLFGKLEFEVARVFYDFRQLEEARKRFEEIIG
jgi:tetratricopeptide (TPR) repeat protein